MQFQLLSLLFQDFPESLIFALAIFALLHFKFNFKQILAIAILQTFTNLIRLLPIAFGMHTLILIITLTVYFRLFTKAKIPKILAATILVFVITTALQAIYAQPLLDYTHLSYDNVDKSPVLRGVFCLPYEIVLFLLALILNYKNKKDSKKLS